jgi:peptidoglycan lytic transglycosylase D
MWSQKINAYSVFLTIAMMFVLIASFRQTEDKSPASAIAGNNDNMLPQVIRSVNVNKAYAFANEAVPMNNFDAVERLDRELSVNSYWHSSTLLNIKNAGRYFPIIEPILAEYGIPEDFKYLAVTESNLRNVTSPAGAKGIWQFVKSTGQYYGLEINRQVDERYHVEKATAAACKYLKEYYEDFGSWTLAAAAYNMGGPSVKKLLVEQHAKTYYDLNVNPETSRYIFRILAIKEIMTSPNDFGFYIEDNELYKPLEYRTVEVIESVPNWGAFAEEQGISYRMLKVYNPWLISGDLTCSGKKVYEVRVPAV